MSTDWVQGVIRSEIEASVRLRQQLLGADAIHRIGFVCQVLSRSCANGGKVIVFGNGGSAADAQHLAAEFVGRFRRDRQPLPALALSADIASITAVGSDLAFERQIEAYGVAGDVAIGLSTSGASESVLRGIRAARRNGLITVGLSGECGQLRQEVDHALCIPATESARIEEAYMLICHIMCEVVERTLFEPSFIERREHAVLVGRP